MVTLSSPSLLRLFQRKSCARYVMETSLLNLPMFAHLNLGGIYLIVRAVIVLYMNKALVFYFQL